MTACRFTLEHGHTCVLNMGTHATCVGRSSSLAPAVWNDSMPHLSCTASTAHRCHRDRGRSSMCGHGANGGIGGSCWFPPWPSSPTQCSDGPPLCQSLSMQRTRCATCRLGRSSRGPAMRPTGERRTCQERCGCGDKKHDDKHAPERGVRQDREEPDQEP